MEKRRKAIKKTARRVPPVRAETTLRNIYYDITNPLSYANPARLLDAAQQINSRITMRQVNDWLAMQDAYTLHRSTRLRFP